jgi:hypothetical protein
MSGILPDSPNQVLVSFCADSSFVEMQGYRVKITTIIFFRNLRPNIESYSMYSIESAVFDKAM